jgi:TolB-like protein/DNA-binding winged helix-turn-helix (wHTH) protein
MTEPDANVVYEFGEFQLDAGQRLLRSRATDRPVTLAAKAFDTLLYLIEHRGQPVEKAALLKAVWPNVVVEENNLNQHISVLRKALGEGTGEHRYIVTIPGRGFQFVAPVQAAARPPAEAQAAPPAPSAAGTPPARPRVWRWWLVGAAALLAAGALAWAWLGLPTAPARVATHNVSRPPQRARPRIAILPFDNLSPDPANAFFTDGLHEEILATLARSAPGMDVISRTTMLHYRRQPATVRQVAQELAATHVLEGSVRREGDQVRLTLQLIDARDDRDLWSQDYDRTLKKALTLQSEVAGEVARQLAVQIVGSSRQAQPLTQSPEAYDLYLKALLRRQSFSGFGPASEQREIEDLFSRALALDPSFAEAYAQRAGFRIALFAFNYDTSEQQVQRIRADIAAARGLAPHDPDVLAAEAIYLHWIAKDPPRALASYQAAEAAGLADPVYLAGEGVLLIGMGRGPEGMELINHSLAVDPANSFLLGTAAGGEAELGRIADSVRTLDHALAHFPDDPTLHFLNGQLRYVYTGNTDEWRRALERFSPAGGETLIAQNVELLFAEHRYAELQRFLEHVDVEAVRVVTGPGGGNSFGVGQLPVADYRGWAALMLRDASRARAAGRAVLSFIGRQDDSPRNHWFLRLLAADAHTFLGERAKAIAAAQECLSLMPRNRDRANGNEAAFAAARVFAWAGLQDAAVDQLVLLGSGAGWEGPYVYRDPILARTLAANARYQALMTQFAARAAAAHLE